MTHLELLLLCSWLKVLDRQLRSEYVFGLNLLKLFADGALEGDFLRWIFVMRMAALEEELDGMRK